MKLKPDLIVAEPLAGKPCPVDRVFAFLDVLFGCGALIVEADDPVRLHRQIGDDKADAGEQVTGVPLHLGDDAAGCVPRCGLILEVMEETTNIVGWAANRTLQQVSYGVL